MKMQLKRIVSAVCAVALCASMMSTSVFAVGTDDDPSTTTTTLTGDAGENGGAGTESEAPDWETLLKDFDYSTVPETMNAQVITLNVGDEQTVTSDEHRYSWWTLGVLGSQGVVELSEKTDSSVLVTALKPGTVKLYHLWWTSRGITGRCFTITVTESEEPENPEDPQPSGEIYFYVSLPGNAAMDDQGSNYRFLTKGGMVSDKASTDLKGENAVIADESEIKTYVEAWPSFTDLGNTGGANYGSTGVDTTSTLNLAEDNSIDSFNISFTDNDNKSITYVPEDTEGNHYALRWTKFSYANTSDAGWQYHLDAMLYRVVTVEDALEAIEATKHVDGNALDENGAAQASSFSFVLTSEDDPQTIESLDLMADVAVSDASTDGIDAQIVAKNDIAEKTELLPGNYKITEKTLDGNVWTSTDTTIEFTVASDGSVTTKTGTDAIINNDLKKYTVTYESGVEDDTDVSGMPAELTQAYAYNASVEVAAAPARNGYDFVGWSDGTDTHSAADKLQITGPVTLTALWKKTETQQPGESGSGTTGSNNNVEVDKTATGLNENGETNVTLTVGGTQEKTVSDVVLVLDKSASTDIRQEAANMLEELKARVDAGNIIKVGVINFEKGVLEYCPLTELNDTNWKTIYNSVIFEKADSAGTNIYGAVKAGEELLDADTEVNDANKHLVLVTDGAGYLWGDVALDGESEDNVYTIYSEESDNMCEALYNGPEEIEKHHDNPTEYYETFTDLAKWYADHSSYAEAIQTYQNTYDNKGHYAASDNGITQGQGTNTDWSSIPKFAGENKYIPSEDRYSLPSASDASVYMTVGLWKEIGEKYNVYAYGDTRYKYNIEENLQWAVKWISNLGDIAGYSQELPEDKADYEGMFDTVKSSVLYSIQSGTVTDVIGNDFDLAGLDSVQLTIGGVPCEQRVVDGNNISFADDKYTVTYYPSGVEGDGREQFVWSINTPVESAAGLKLTYTVKLVNRSAEAGDHTVKTNEEATLEYTSTTGGTGSEEFPVPEVTYHVDAQPVTEPEKPNTSDNNTTSTSTTTTTVTTSKAAEKAQPQAAAPAIPQTGDSMPVGMLGGVAIIAAGVFVALAVIRKRKQN